MFFLVEIFIIRIFEIIWFDMTDRHSEVILFFRIAKNLKSPSGSSVWLCLRIFIVLWLQTVFFLSIVINFGSTQLIIIIISCYSWIHFTNSDYWTNAIILNKSLLATLLWISFIYANGFEMTHFNRLLNKMVNKHFSNGFAESE